jgi:hypothetical protein
VRLRRVTAASRLAVLSLASAPAGADAATDEVSPTVWPHIWNPGYNRDRGPVIVPMLRVHVEM